MKELKALQESPNLNNYNFTDFTMSLQGRIIVNVTVGMGYSKRLIHYENDDGSFSDLEM